MAVMSALLGFTSERRWLRYADKELAGMFPRTMASPAGTSGCGRRLPVHTGNPDAGHGHVAVERRCLGRGFHPGAVRLFPGDGQAQRRGGAGGLGYCASHSRYFWGLRLHLVCTLTGCRSCRPGGREGRRARDPAGHARGRPRRRGSSSRQVIIGDKNYFGRAFEAELTERELTLLRPVRKGEARRAGQNSSSRCARSSSPSTGPSEELDLERHGGKTPEGILARVLARVLALTAAIWHNDKTGQPVMRSLTPTTTKESSH